MNKWTNKWPIKEGVYWFYGYRYGRISCGYECEPEYCLVKVLKISNGFMYTTDGQFMNKSETESAYFKQAILPDPPVNFPYNVSVQGHTG